MRALLSDVLVFIILILFTCVNDVFSRNAVSRKECDDVKPFFYGKNISVEYPEDQQQQPASKSEYNNIRIYVYH